MSPLNRDMSGSHVYDLGRRTISVEGFVRFRYRQGWAHEPNPDDPLEVARNTNRVARATPFARAGSHGGSEGQFCEK